MNQTFAVWPFKFRSLYVYHITRYYYYHYFIFIYVWQVGRHFAYPWSNLAREYFSDRGESTVRKIIQNGDRRIDTRRIDIRN